MKRRSSVRIGSNSDEMCKAMQRYQQGEPAANVPGLTDDQRAKLDSMFRGIVDDDGEERHKVWLKAIKDGDFGFPGVALSYIGKGVGSWKHEAIGDRRSKQKKSEVFPYDPSFLDSDWKHFHDALLGHRYVVLHTILPRYGICAA